VWNKVDGVKQWCTGVHRNCDNEVIEENKEREREEKREKDEEDRKIREMLGGGGAPVVATGRANVRGSSRRQNRLVQNNRSQNPTLLQVPQGNNRNNQKDAHNQHLKEEASGDDAVAERPAADRNARDGDSDDEKNIPPGINTSRVSHDLPPILPPQSGNNKSVSVSHPQPSVKSERSVQDSESESQGSSKSKQSRKSSRRVRKSNLSRRKQTGAKKSATKKSGGAKKPLELEIISEERGSEERGSEKAISERAIPGGNDGLKGKAKPEADKAKPGADKVKPGADALAGNPVANLRGKPAVKNPVAKNPVAKNPLPENSVAPPVVSAKPAGSKQRDDKPVEDNQGTGQSDVEKRVRKSIPLGGFQAFMKNKVEKQKEKEEKMEKQKEKEEQK
jgi:hypothetical protein